MQSEETEPELPCNFIGKYTRYKAEQTYVVSDPVGVIYFPES